MADQSAQIQTNSLKPAEASSDAGMARQHSIGDQIAADRYAAAKSSLRGKNRGVRFSKIIPSGAMGDQQGTNPAGGSSFDSGE